MTEKFVRFISRLKLDRPRIAFALWMVMALIPTIAKLRPDRHNNFTIFRSSWFHLSEGLSLYQPYPSEYFDLYLYGPLFAFLIAPISILPEPLGYTVWMLGLASLLFYAIAKLDLELHERIFIGLFSVKELISGLMMMQYNVGIGAMIILTFALLERKKEGWAALVLVIATLTKIYGIVALAFFPFCQRKWTFVGYCLLWGIALTLLPLLMGIDYGIGQYQEWLETLASKNGINHFAERQNISLLGMVRKTTMNPDYSDLWLIAGGLLVWGLSYLRFAQYEAKGYRLGQLAVVLLFVVLFSTGSESSSYIICVPGIALWFLSRPMAMRTKWDIALLIGTLILSSWSSTDLIPKAIKEGYIVRYSLKALFPALVFLKACYELLSVDYLREAKTPKLCA